MIHEFVDAMDLREQQWFCDAWHLCARRNQRPKLSNWRTWLLLGGRGSGKTRTGAEWIKGLIAKNGLYSGDAAGRVALVGSSYAEVRDVMIEGESGLLQIYTRTDRPTWLSSRRRLEWSDGTVGLAFSSADPEQLRGNQFGAAWCDEFAKWPYLETTWNMLQFCMRLGSNPRQVITTTPRALKILKQLMKDPTTVVTRSKTLDNAHHLAPGFIDYLGTLYGGTRLGRQELDGEIVEDRENALWTRELLENLRVQKFSDLNRIVVAVDPPATSNSGSAACGIVAVGENGAGKCFVLEDASVEQASPSMWSNAVVRLFHKLGADGVVAETNQGGEMVKTIINTADPKVPVKMVHASRGKWLRAEPVAHLYERGAVHHVGSFPKLEDQMCDFGHDGLSSGKSPDRLDALVWAITNLVLSDRSQPKIRNA